MFLSAILEKFLIKVLKYILKNILIFFLRRKWQSLFWVKTWRTDKLTLYCLFALPADYPNNHSKHAQSFCRDFDWRSASRF